MLCSRLFALLVLLLALMDTSLAEETPAEVTTVQSARSRIEPYVNWLPSASETLVVLNHSYAVPHDSGNQTSFYLLGLDASFREIHLRRMFARDVRKVLVGKRLKLWIEASSRFHFPEFPEQVIDVAPSIGVVLQYDGCHVLVFDDETPVDTTHLFEKLLQQHPEPTSHVPAASRHQIAGHETISWSASPPDVEPDRIATPEQRKRIDAVLSTRYWIASPQQNVLVVATSADVLAETLRKVDNPDQTAFPASLEEWKYIAGDMPIWGMRHYYLSERRPGDYSDLREDEEKELLGFTFEIDANADLARLTFLDCNPRMKSDLKYNVLTYISSEAVFTQEPDGTLVVQLDWSQSSPKEAFEVMSDLAGWLLIHLGSAFVI